MKGGGEGLGAGRPRRTAALPVRHTYARFLDWHNLRAASSAPESALPARAGPGGAGQGQREAPDHHPNMLLSPPFPGLGPRQWARGYWNLFDAVIVVVGVMSWALQAPALSSLRLLRVARLVLVMHYAVEMKVIFKSLWLALPAVSNMLLLQVASRVHFSRSSPTPELYSVLAWLPPPPPPTLPKGLVHNLLVQFFTPNSPTIKIFTPIFVML